MRYDFVKSIKRPAIVFVVCTLILLSIMIIIFPKLDRLITFFSFILAFGSIFLEIRRNQAEQVSDMKTLILKMISEMRDIVKNKRKDNHLYMISFTPAFGNISEPDLYKEYNKLLNEVVQKCDDVIIICYDENKRREYHRDWLKLLNVTDHDKKIIKMNEWEKEAQDLIDDVRKYHGFNSVLEVEHIQPILFFSTKNILINYMLKYPSTSKAKSSQNLKSDIYGIMYPENEGISFFENAFEEYKINNQLGPAEILFRHYMSKDECNRYISSAHKLKNKIIKSSSQEKPSNVLLAYGGGKDSTMALLFIRLAQEQSKKYTKTPFKLHILVHKHPGMRDDVFANIKTVFKVLGIEEDTENVIIKYKSKNDTLNDIDDEIPIHTKNRFIKEILLMGHLSKGMGRHTFCYTCNIDMIMSVLNYTLTTDDAIDFIVTGDSKEEKTTYLKWLSKIFSVINPSEYTEINSEFAPDKFYDNFLKFQNKFYEMYGACGYSYTQNPNKLPSYPKPLKIHEEFDVSLKDFKCILDKIGFNFQGTSSSFSETDCFYPKIMALLAGLRGGKYEVVFREAYLNKVIGRMPKKGFTREMIKKEIDSFKNTETINLIREFIYTDLKITKDQLNSIVYSPFLENGKNLQLFLKENEYFLKRKSIDDLTSEQIIDFINNHEKHSPNEELTKKIFTLLNELFGEHLEIKDYKTILNYDINNEISLQNIAHYGDPFVYTYNIKIGDETIEETNGGR